MQCIQFLSWEVAQSAGEVSAVLALPSVAQLFHVFKGIDADAAQMPTASSRKKQQR